MTVARLIAALQGLPEPLKGLPVFVDKGTGLDFPIGSMTHRPTIDEKAHPQVAGRPERFTLG